MREMLSGPGNDKLAELLWADDGPAFRRPPPLFPPFATTRPRPDLLAKHPAPLDAMRDLLAVQEDEDAVPWLHYPIVGVEDDGGGHCAVPLPAEYCSPGLLPGYSDALPAAVAGREAGDAHAQPSTSHGGAVGVPKQQPRPSGGESVLNFTFFSRPLHRPPAPAPVESMSTAAVTTNQLRSTPLFSEQRMAWLQPPPPKVTTAAAAPAPPPPAPAPVTLRHPEPAPPLTRLQPEARAPESAPAPLPPAATATTSSVCSDNGDRSHQLKRSSHQAAAEWSLSQDDEDLDDEAGGLRRSAAGARSTKRGRTAEVHNMSERRRRDRINEKMRALQELIPNCNKIDKASMLEEAIEYLKTLQLQVQMMSSMGPAAAAAGLCVPPMLAMQMAPMGMGMGMAHFHHHHLGAMGFGMGAAFDPRLVAAAAAAQFPCGPMPTFAFPGAHAMPSMPPFPQTAPAAAAGAHFVINNASGGAQPEQVPDNHPAASP